MNSQLILTACGVFAAILALALSFYMKHKDIFDKRVKIIFIILLFIDLIVFTYALISSPVDVNSPPMVVSLMPDKMSPQEAGTSIKWTGTALDPENDPIQYKFLLDSQQKTDWSYDPTWNWTTSSADVRSHTIEVKVKDGNHNPSGDDSKNVDFSISHRKVNSLPIVFSLMPNKINSQIAGTTIKWTAAALDPDGDQIFYEYSLNGDPVTEWSKDNAWTWQTREKDIGSSIIEVSVRDKNHADPSGSDGNVSTSFTITAPEIIFPDPNLEAVIRAAINKPNGAIYATDLGQLKRLDAREKGIKDIAGLEYCNTLELLNLSYNEITDISPLAGLKNLKKLYLIKTQIIDISPLSGLTGLEVLVLVYNQITDISALSELKNLKILYLSENQIIDISPLSGLTSLEVLELDYNQITDISALSELKNLKQLILEDNKITDISALSGLTTIFNLRLGQNQITDISALSGLTTIFNLELDQNQITDISPLAGLTNLERLLLDGNQITDISPLSALTNLKTLDLRGNQITNVSPLAGLTNLEIYR